MILPGGIGAAIADVRDAYLRWVAGAANLLVPSLLADRKADDPVEIPPDHRGRGRGGRGRAHRGAPVMSERTGLATRRHRRRAALPARDPVRAQRGRPGGPADVRPPRPEHPGLLRLNNADFLLIVALGLVLGLLLSIPFGFAADRIPRLPIVIGGAIAFGVFSMLTGLATTIWVLVIARAGAGFGTAVSTPTHNSLLADYYDIPVRPKVYSVHRAALAVGACLGPLMAGLLTSWFSWRVPFIVLIVPTAIFVILALLLREPVRGHFEREAMGADAETAATEVAAPSYAESWRVCWNVGTLRRIFYALPFLAVAFIGLEIFGSLFYQQVFHLNAPTGVRLRARRTGPAHRAAAHHPYHHPPVRAERDARAPLRRRRRLAVAVAWTAFALSPNLVVAVILNALVTGIVVLIVPPIFAALSLAIPPKIRSFGFAVAALWILPGLLLLPIVGGIADEWGIRTGLVLMVPVFLVGAVVVASAGQGDREGHQAGVDLRGRPVRGAVRAAPGPVQAAARPGRLRPLRRRAGALQRGPRGRRGRDRRAARDERRREVDAAQGDHRARRGRPRARSSSTVAT